MQRGPTNVECTQLCHINHVQKQQVHASPMKTPSEAAVFVVEKGISMDYESQAFATTVATYSKNIHRPANLSVGEMDIIPLEDVLDATRGMPEVLEKNLHLEAWENDDDIKGDDDSSLLISNDSEVTNPNNPLAVLSLNGAEVANAALAI